MIVRIINGNGVPLKTREFEPDQHADCNFVVVANGDDFGSYLPQSPIRVEVEIPELEGNASYASNARMETIRDKLVDLQHGLRLLPPTPSGSGLMSMVERMAEIMELMTDAIMGAE